MTGRKKSLAFWLLAIAGLVSIVEPSYASRPNHRRARGLYCPDKGQLQRVSGSGNMSVRASNPFAKPLTVQAINRIRQSTSVVPARSRMVVTSAYRSCRYNHSIGGASRSSHLTGEAIDFALTPGFSPPQTAAVLHRQIASFGMGRAIYNTCSPHVHIDFRRGGSFNECGGRGSRSPACRYQRGGCKR